jgi:hypothetical protein
MKKYLTLPLLLIATVTLAQPPQVEWAKCYGGGFDDKAMSVVSTDDGGYIICGQTASIDGDVTFNNGGIDGWVVKTDNGGNIQWQKSYGGSNNDIFRSVLPVSGGRFVLCGETASTDGDITTLNHGLTDVWVVQIDGAGTLMWQNTYGGSNEDLGTDLIVADSGYFVVGQTFSDDGDIQSYKDSGDAWLIVIDSVGTLTDQKTKGGSSEDIFNEIKPTAFGGYIICGTTFSNDGSVNDLNHGGSDAWLIKLSKNGSAQWTYCYGDTGDDGGYRILQNADGSYVISGHYYDGTNQDSWLLGVDSNGIVTASFAYGGDSTEIAGPILQDPLGAYVLGPSSSSPISGDLTCHLGETDIWLYSSSVSSTLNWQQCLGGSGDEFSSESLLGSDSSIVIAGYTNSLDGNVSDNHGGFDFLAGKVDFRLFCACKLYL